MNKDRIQFAKYQGNGNDFVLIDLDDNGLNPESMAVFKTQAREICRRHFGIGADGLILLYEENDKRHMNVINADGTWAKNCGNGLRCAAHWYFSKKNSNSISIKFCNETYICEKNGDFIGVNMGLCKVRPISINNITEPAFLANIKNSHLVIFKDTKELSDAYITHILSQDVAKDKNVGFIFRNNDHWISRVHERGVGFTNSCGSGAAAALCTLRHMGLVKTNSLIKIKQPGGLLKLKITESLGNNSYLVFQSGLQNKVFEGYVTLPSVG